jgi:pimeloyl-ACP methyl ester carboxylesterase
MNIKTDFKLEIIEVKSSNKRYKTPLLFIHGAGHGAWCWEENYMPFFAEQGWDCLALNLRGHGNSKGRDQLDQFSLEDYVTDVLSVLEGRGILPIIIGHSMGGGVAQLLMSKHPEMISGVVLLASMPPGWISFVEFLRFFRYPSGCLAMQRLMQGKATTVKGIHKSPFFSKRISLSQANTYFSLLQPESKLALCDMHEMQTKGGKQVLPLMVIGSKKDYLFGEKALIKTAKHYKTDAIILNEGCHDLMLDPNWLQSAQRILAWLECSFFEENENNQGAKKRRISTEGSAGTKLEVLI